ncbi:MAG: RDD family protein [Deltaproteobacteria bacterium]|nr:RDD family protein [Deltaproteobacteria bacterium]
MGREEGIYFDIKDYGSLVRRFSAITIDMAFLLLLFILAGALWSLLFIPPDLDLAYYYGIKVFIYFEPEFFSLCLILAYIYLAILKPRPIRTIGYRLTGLKIIDLKGEQPSLLKMTWRFVLLAFGPFHLLFDIFWLGGDDNRQSLRDKLAGTYVIRKNAIPSGRGTIGYSQYGLFCYQLIFSEVMRKKGTG